MEAQEFKNRIKEVKDLIKGKTVQFATKNRICPFYTLRDFGMAVLEQEQYGYSFQIGQVWTTDGIKMVDTFNDFVDMLKSGIVTGFRVAAYYQPKDECEYIRSFGSLD